MFVCEKNSSCCDHQYWDKWEDVEQEAQECGHLIEVAPVVHGRWGELETHVHTPSLNGYPCTICGQREQQKANYCPNCGARMDEGV